MNCIQLFSFRGTMKKLFNKRYQNTINMWIRYRVQIMLIVHIVDGYIMAASAAFMQDYELYKCIM